MASAQRNDPSSGAHIFSLVVVVGKILGGSAMMCKSAAAEESDTTHKQTNSECIEQVSSMQATDYHVEVAVVVLNGKWALSFPSLSLYLSLLHCLPTGSQ